MIRNRKKRQEFLKNKYAGKRTNSQQTTETIVKRSPKVELVKADKKTRLSQDAIKRYSGKSKTRGYDPNRLNANNRSRLFSLYWENDRLWFEIKPQSYRSVKYEYFRVAVGDRNGIYTDSADFADDPLIDSIDMLAYSLDMSPGRLKKSIANYWQKTVNQ
jgi:hypothetical protein